MEGGGPAARRADTPPWALTTVWRTAGTAHSTIPPEESPEKGTVLMKNPTRSKHIKGDDDVELTVLGCRVDILGTNCDLTSA